MGKKKRQSLAETIQKYREPDQLLKGNVLLENPKIIIAILSILDFMALMVANACLQAFDHLLCQDFSGLFRFSYFFIPVLRYWRVYLVLAAGLITLDVKIYLEFRNAFRDDNVGQKGSRRFTTMNEIKAQYKAVPELPDGERFPGYGGLPVACMDGIMYLDDSAVNNLHLGITRSGKGELFSFREIDSYSRAEKQDSLVILDMKFDLIKSMYRSLAERGYKVYSVNFENPVEGNGFNPLYLIRKFYKKGKTDEAEQLCRSLAYSYFVSKAGGSGDDNSDFFLSNSTSALTASIWAHMADCFAADARESAPLILHFLQAQMAFEGLEAELQEEARVRYEKNKRLPVKQLLRVCRELPPEAEFVPVTDNEGKINMASVINMFSSLARQHIDSRTTMLDLYFSSRSRYDRAKAIYASIEVTGDRTKGSIFSQMLTKISMYSTGQMAQMTSHSDFDLEELGFGDKPVALFLELPFYDRSRDAVAMTLIDQAFQTNARAAAQTKKMKCDRRIVFHLDEVAQCPPIAELDTKLSVGLGIGILFNLFIQSYQQLEDRYGATAKTIRANCANHIYLQTSEYDTAEAFSKEVGNKTIRNVNRSGKRFSTSKTYTEMYEEKPLKNANELMELMPGESIITRAMRRTDLQGNKAAPRPIANLEQEGRAYRYRYEYLKETFPNPEDVDIMDLDLARIQPIKETDYMFRYGEQLDYYEFLSLRKSKQALENGQIPEERVAELSEELKRLPGLQLKYQYDARLTEQQLLQDLRDTGMEVRENDTKAILLQKLMLLPLPAAERYRLAEQIRKGESMYDS